MSNRHVDAPFLPHNGGIGTVSIAVTAASASVALPAMESHGTIRLVNAGAAVTFVRFGKGAATAVTTDLPLLPNSVSVIAVPEELTNRSDVYIAAIGTAANTLYATAGDGR
jgi:hypothetical protein